MGSPALLLLRRKSWYGFLSPLKIYRPLPGFNLQTLGPMASTITIQTTEGDTVTYTPIAILVITATIDNLGCRG
jgi:hypothetical protein